MKIRRVLRVSVGLAGVVSLTVGCGKKGADPEPVTVTAAAQRHEHKPPHGGTPVVLGDEAYHVELILDHSSGTLQVYVLDGEMENFIRVPASSMEIEARVNGAPQTLVLRAVANPATGETIGDTALFSAQADWLKNAREFDGVLPKIAIRGTIFTDVKFNFPRGNDKD